MKMRSALLATVIALAPLGLSVTADAQTPNQPVAPQPKVNLTLEQRFTIKELIKDLNVQPAPANSDTTVGDTVPASIKLNPMPPDVAAKVPQVKSHMFFLADGKVVIVDPKENKIVDAFN
jgi:hypothetical protein